MPFSLGFWANSVSGLKWEYKTLQSFATYGDAVYAPLANASWFAQINYGGSSGNQYAYSSDAITWSTGTMPANRRWRIMMTNGSRVVALASDTAAGAYTTNGTTWTAFTDGATNVRQGIHDGTRFLAVTESTAGDGLIYSTDGADYQGIDVGNGGYAIAFDGTSRYIVLSATGTATHRTCTSTPTTAGNWSDITLPISAFWSALAYGNGTWVAFREGTTYYAYSTNGTTWTAGTLTRAFGTGGTSYTHRATFANGKFYYYSVSTGATRYLESSTDGITWTTELSAPSTNTITAIRAWASNGSKIIGVGASSTYQYLYGA